MAPSGGLKQSAVLLSVAASVKRHGVNPWAYLKRVLTKLPSRPGPTWPMYFRTRDHVPGRCAVGPG